MNGNGRLAMFGNFKRLAVTTAVAAALVSGYATSANAIAFNIDWTGSGGYTMTGMFSYDDSLIGTGAIDENDVMSFMIEGFLNGGSVGT